MGVFEMHPVVCSGGMGVSAEVSSARLFCDVDGKQPRLPIGIFNTLAVEFCSTLMAQAQQLDRIIEDVNRGQDRDLQLSSHDGPHDLRQESLPSMTKHTAVEPAAVSVGLKKSQELGKKSGDSCEESEKSCTSGLEPHHVNHYARCRPVLTAREARAKLRNMGASLHLAHEEAADTLGKQKTDTLFTDLEAMKKHIRHEILKPYNVAKYYHDDGICRRIAASSKFEMMTLSIICVNALWIAVDIDSNGAKLNKEKPAFFQILEWCFFIYFSSEILIRLGAFRSKRNCVRDFWFVFDSTLVLLMWLDSLVPLVFDTALGLDPSFLRLARLIKLSRMARIARLLHKFPELNLLIRGIGLGARSVLSSFVLLAIVVYLFAVAFRFLTIDTNVGSTYFPTVPRAMKHLVLMATMPDALDMINSLGYEQVLSGFVFVAFIGIATLTIMNMLVAILVEVIRSAAVFENEANKAHRVKDHLCMVMEKTGFGQNIDDNRIISKNNFQQLLLNKSVVTAMRSVGVDAVGLLDSTECIFPDAVDSDRLYKSHSRSDLVESSEQHGITFEKLVELICALGGTNGATVKDVIDMRQVVLHRMIAVEESIEESMAKQLHSMQALVSQLIHGLRQEQDANEVIETHLCNPELLIL